MVHAGCVFVDSIHPSRKWMSWSFESMRWNVRVHRLDFELYSHLKEFWGNGVRTHANSKGKIPSTWSSEENQTHDTASRWTVSPIHYQLSYSGPPKTHLNFVIIFITNVIHQPTVLYVIFCNAQHWNFWCYISYQNHDKHPSFKLTSNLTWKLISYRHWTSYINTL